MLGRHYLLGPFQCGIDTFGRSSDGSRLYAWVLCADRRTGPHAKDLSGGRLPGVLTVSGSGAFTKLEQAEFPRIDHRSADIRRLFPRDVRGMAWECGPCDPRPSLHEMLARARDIVAA